MKLAIQMVALFGAGYYFREIIEYSKKYLRKDPPIYIRDWEEKLD